MARPLRLHIPGMVYHVMSRGNNKQNIFLDDDDYRHFIDRLAKACQRFEVRCPAYCLMRTHVHLMLEPSEYPLSRALQQVLSPYALRFNRRHKQVGHLLQGRFKSLLVETDVAFLRLLRYVLRNPVAAHYVEQPGDWPWSSYPATAGLSEAPPFLDVDRVWRVLDAENASEAREQLTVFLADASDDQVWQDCLALGSAAFLKSLGQSLRPYRDVEDFVYKVRFADRPPLSDLLSSEASRTEQSVAMRRAFVEFAYTLREIGRYLDRPTSTVWTQIHRVTQSPGGLSTSLPQPDST